MGHDYTKKLKPEGQIQGAAGRAASIRRRRAMSLVGRRRRLEQVGMIDKFSSYTDYSGGVSPFCNSPEVGVGCRPLSDFA